MVTTFAGGTEGDDDSTGIAVQFDAPQGMAVDLSGNLYVVDSGNHLIRKIEYK